MKLLVKIAVALVHWLMKHPAVQDAIRERFEQRVLNCGKLRCGSK